MFNNKKLHKTHTKTIEHKNNNNRTNLTLEKQQNDKHKNDKVNKNNKINKKWKTKPNS